MIPVPVISSKCCRYVTAVCSACNKQQLREKDLEKFCIRLWRGIQESTMQICKSLMLRDFWQHTFTLLFYGCINHHYNFVPHMHADLKASYRIPIEALIYNSQRNTRVQQTLSLQFQSTKFINQLGKTVTNKANEFEYLTCLQNSFETFGLKKKQHQ